MRATIGPALAQQVQDCYRAVALECLRGTCHRVMIVGEAKFDASAHMAGRDALRSLALAGVAPDFRIAFVALTTNLIGIYDDAVLEADRLGVDARRFGSEGEAARWLGA